jgi:hypothetical protein
MPFADVRDAEAEAVDRVIDELGVADRRGRRVVGRSVPAATAVSATAAGSDQCGGRRQQSQAPGDAHPARIEI